MVALSTSWSAGNVDNGEHLVETLHQFDINGIELEYRIKAPVFEQMKGALKRSPVPVVSIHNYFPAPVDRPGSGNLFILSDPDREERKRAIEATVRSLQHAHDLEAGAVVLHCGHVVMDPEEDTFRRFYREDRIESEEAREFIEAKLEERRQKRPPYLDSLFFSLDRLSRETEKYGVVLGLENRYHVHELPGLEEFEIIFSEFQGAPLGYWHDTGHDRSLTAWGVIPPMALPDRFQSHLVGCHLHDAKGLDDHQPPGSGDIDFEALKPYLKKDTLRVLELKPGTPNEAVAESIEHLNRLGL